jgi:hypothetical protein
LFVGLIIIGNPETLATDDTWSEWISFVNTNSLMVDYPKYKQAIQTHMQSVNQRGMNGQTQYQAPHNQQLQQQQQFLQQAMQQRLQQQQQQDLREQQQMHQQQQYQQQQQWQQQQQQWQQIQYQQQQGTFDP